MKRRPVLLGIVVAGISALAACNGGGGANPPPVAIVPCVVPSGTLVALAYPEPGATHVPDSPGQIVIAVSSPLPPSTASAAATGPRCSARSASSIPTPYATPTFAAPSYESSGLGSALPAGTTMEVLLNDQSSSCNQFPQIGSFTTQ